MLSPQLKTILPILIGAGVIGLAVLGKAAIDAKSLNYDVSGFDLAGGTISLDIINASDSSYTVKALTADVNVNDTRVAIVNYVGQVVIMPIATTTLNLSLKLEPSGILQVLIGGAKSLLLASDEDKAAGITETVTISGSINVDGIMLPFDTTMAVVKV